MRSLHLSSIVTAASLLGGCIAMSPAVNTRETSLQPTFGDAETITSEPTWDTLAPGLEQRFYRPGGDYPLTQFTILRVDPSLYTFRVHYSPRFPRTVGEWRQDIPQAAAFINANFFDPLGNALGLLISDGVAYTPAYVGFGGMFQVENNIPSIRSTIRQPYTGEPLEQASQAFPMLVLDGLPTYERMEGDRASRRTVIAQDYSGRVLLISTSSLIGMRLSDLSVYLTQTDLQVESALNLDGGGSSLMAVNMFASYTIPSFDPVPAVIAVYSRQDGS